jgi:hypothetical protein
LQVPGLDELTEEKPAVGFDFAKLVFKSRGEEFDKSLEQIKAYATNASPVRIYKTNIDLAKVYS